MATMVESNRGLIQKKTSTNIAIVTQNKGISVFELLKTNPIFYQIVYPHFCLIRKTLSENTHTHTHHFSAVLVSAIFEPLTVFGPL